MEASALLAALETCLRPEIDKLGGRLSMLGNEAEAVMHLQTGTDRWRCVLLADGESVVDDPGFQEGGIVDHQLRVLIQHQAGPLEMEKGAGHFKADGKHGAPLLVRCTQVRLLIMRTRFYRLLSAGPGAESQPAGDVDHEAGWRYLGRQPYVPNEELLKLRTWELSFRLRAGLLTPDLEGDDPIIKALLPLTES